MGQISVMISQLNLEKVGYKNFHMNFNLMGSLRVVFMEC